MDRLDIWELKPEGMEKYLSEYGWHFSKKMCEWAVSNMKDRNGNKVVAKDKTALEDMFKNNKMEVKAKAYDAVYIEAMCRADYLGNSIPNDMQALKFVKDYIDDVDGYDGLAFTRFYADCCAKGMPVMWEDML